MTAYRQHCPVATAAEVLGQSWTLLIVRELLHGSSRTGEIAQGVPGMSTALLARRLKQLADAGVVTRLDSPGEVRFALTPAGRDLAPMVEHLGYWGRRWLPPPRSGDLQPRLPTVARIDCTVSALAAVWLGHRTWREALTERTIRFEGTREAVRNTITWLGQNRFTERFPRKQDD